eukprot:3327873-Rhodomonas_salina.1
MAKKSSKPKGGVAAAAKYGAAGPVKAGKKKVVETPSPAPPTVRADHGEGGAAAGPSKSGKKVVVEAAITKPTNPPAPTTVRADGEGSARKRQHEKISSSQALDTEAKWDIRYGTTEVLAVYTAGDSEYGFVILEDDVLFADKDEEAE